MIRTKDLTLPLNDQNVNVDDDLTDEVKHVCGHQHRPGVFIVGLSEGFRHRGSVLLYNILQRFIFDSHTSALSDVNALT